MVQSIKLNFSPTEVQIKKFEDILQAENNYLKYLQNLFKENKPFIDEASFKIRSMSALDVDTVFLRGVYIWFRDWRKYGRNLKSLSSSSLNIQNFRIPPEYCKFEGYNLSIKGLGEFVLPVEIENGIINPGIFEIDYIRLTKSTNGKFYFRIIYKG